MTESFFGDMHMSISYEKYFDEKFKDIKENIAELRQQAVIDKAELLAKIGALPCSEHRQRIDRIDQGETNRVDNAARRRRVKIDKVAIWRLVVSIALVVIAIVSLMEAFGKL
jgi:hypothetical protein